MKQKYSNKKRNKVTLLAGVLTLFIVTPVLAAVLVQNFVRNEVVVADPPIVKEAGADDAATDYIDVTTTGTTISNGDTANTETLLNQEVVTFTCFTGDRTYYTDALRLRNTTATEDWDVALRVEADLAGNAATTGGAFNDDADIWLFANTANAPVANIAPPNPAAIPAVWNTDYIQLESDGTNLSVADATIASFTIPATEQRQVGIVVDCGSNATSATTGTFRMTVEATPN